MRGDCSTNGQRQSTYDFPTSTFTLGEGSPLDGEDCQLRERERAPRPYRYGPRTSTADTVSSASPADDSHPSSASHCFDTRSFAPDQPSQSPFMSETPRSGSTSYQLAEDCPPASPSHIDFNETDYPAILVTPKGKPYDLYPTWKGKDETKRGCFFPGNYWMKKWLSETRYQHICPVDLCRTVFDNVISLSNHMNCVHAKACFNDNCDGLLTVVGKWEGKAKVVSQGPLKHRPVVVAPHYSKHHVEKTPEPHGDSINVSGDSRSSSLEPHQPHNYHTRAKRARISRDGSDETLGRAPEHSSPSPMEPDADTASRDEEPTTDSNTPGWAPPAAGRLLQSQLYELYPRVVGIRSGEEKNLVRNVITMILRTTERNTNLHELFADIEELDARRRGPVLRCLASLLELVERPRQSDAAPPEELGRGGHFKLQVGILRLPNGSPDDEQAVVCDCMALMLGGLGRSAELSELFGAAKRIGEKKRERFFRIVSLLLERAERPRSYGNRGRG